jgi:dTDP-3,4-didehydro-2,6-dideoxy-alpha-D-glucose 3-reductase
MNILFLGFSRIVQKRVLPASRRVPGLQPTEVATYTSRAAGSDSGMLVFDDYDQALRESSAKLVYVSTVNSDHAKWVEAALKHGRHVVVDKPAFSRLEDAHRLVELAQRSGLCLAEAVVYTHHPQVEMAKEFLAQAEISPTRLTAVFSFPPLDSGNFRYKQVLGGGALNDLGPYAVSVGRFFFGDAPAEIVARIHGHAGEVESSFSLLATYPGGRCLAGHFGFDTEYCNRLQVLGPGASVELDRVFTPPTDEALEFTVRRSNKVEKRTAPAGDSFASFLREVTEAIEGGHADGFARQLLADAEVLDRLRKAAGT